jgi:hypothetical protein
VPALPALHWSFAVHWHCPFWQTKLGGHACPHAPQLTMLLVTSTQPVWQHAWPPRHGPPMLHEHASVDVDWRAQSSPAPQVVPPQTQAPPLQVPFAPFTLHCASPVQPHRGTPIPLSTHVSGCPCGPCELQALPQLPHIALLSTVVSQPSSGMGAIGMVQFPNPGAHVELQTLFEQPSDATLVPSQRRPHCPQLSGSAATCTSQPFPASWSQSP